MNATWTTNKLVFRIPSQQHTDKHRFIYGTKIRRMPSSRDMQISLSSYKLTLIWKSQPNQINEIGMISSMAKMVPFEAYFVAQISFFLVRSSQRMLETSRDLFKVGVLPCNWKKCWKELLVYKNDDKRATLSFF